jgi:rhodanese-related sulfurtransferase
MYLNYNQLEDLQQHQSMLIFDCRNVDVFSDGYVQGSIFAGYHQLNFNHLANVFPKDMGIVVIMEKPEDEKVIKEQLDKSGFQNYKGAIIFHYGEWKSNQGDIDLIITIEADELAMDIPHDENLMLIDIREADEYNESHFSGTHSLPLSEMGDPANIAILPEGANLYLFCTDGERSLTAATILKRHGLHNLRVVMATWDMLLNTKGMEIDKNKNGKLN